MPIINLKRLKETGKNKITQIATVFLGLVILVTIISYYNKDIGSLIGLLLYLFSIFMFAILFFKIFYSEIFNQPRQIILMEIIIILMLLLIISIETTQTLSKYLIPTAAASILLTILLNPEVALVNIFIIGLIAGIIGNFSLDGFFVCMVGGIAGIYSSRQVRNRKDLNRSGLYVLVANIVSITAVSLLTGESFTRLGINIGWGAGNALISVIIASGLLPIFESLFGITTSIRLLELGDFNQPLLKKLMLDAPGTYHHSLMVGNLVDNACEKIGANPLLSRVGAYYHDIGKMNNPHYFIENQMHARDNHKNLKPNISALILKRHVKDGLTMAEENKLDKVIKDFIVQHHGTTLIEFFYKKGLKETKNKSAVDKKEYRYPGPRPRTKEAGVLMLADSVEAACRVLDEPTYSRISGLVTKIINNKFIDEQLSHCNITLSNLEDIQKSFTKSLSSIYHSRIEYPEDKEEN